MKCRICKSKLVNNECLCCEKLDDYKCDPDKLEVLRRFRPLVPELQADCEV